MLTGSIQEFIKHHALHEIGIFTGSRLIGWKSDPPGGSSDSDWDFGLRVHDYHRITSYVPKEEMKDSEYFITGTRINFLDGELNLFIIREAEWNSWRIATATMKGFAEAAAGNGVLLSKDVVHGLHEVILGYCKGTRL